LTLADDRRLTTDDCFQVCHLHRRQRRFETFVAHLQASAIDGLLQGLTSEDAEGVRNSRFLRRLADAARDFVNDDVVMGGVASQQATEADDGVVLLGFGKRACCRWNFESAGDADDLDASVIKALKRETTIAKYFPLAVSLPSSALSRRLDGAFKFYSCPNPCRSA